MRIISLVPSCTEILFYLGLGDQVVGVTANCDFPLEVRHKEQVGYFSSPNIPKIISMKPDLVISGGEIHREHGDQLHKAGIDLLDFDPLTIDALLDGMVELLYRTGLPVNTGRVDLLKMKRGSIEAEFSHMGIRRPRLAFVLGEGTLAAPGPANCQYDALKICGALPMPSARNDSFMLITWENVAAFNPEIILACGCGPDEKPRRRCPGCTVEKRSCARDIVDVKRNPSLSNVIAVMRGRVYAVPCHFFCRPGPRLFQGMEWLAGLIKQL